MTTAAPAGSAVAVVELTGVRHSYGSAGRALTVLDGIDMTLAAGEVVGITGPSGTGKSTLLRIVAGLEAPEAGMLHYAGHPTWRGRRRRVRYPRPGYVMPVFQDPYASLDPRWPIWQTLAEPMGRVDRVSAARATTASLERVGLEHLDLDARPSELSGGQCQRIAILRALAARPALIVADEPTARQDLITGAAVAHLFRDATDAGTAILVVSHDTSWLHSIADRVHRLSGGHLLDG